MLGVFLAVFLLGPFTMTTHAKLSEETLNVYAQNNILFYDPYGSIVCEELEEVSAPAEEAGPSPGGTRSYREVDPSSYFFSTDDNASAIMSILMANGYSKEAAAAILGNLYWESAGFNPRIIEGGAIVSEDFRAWDGGKTFNGGFGLAQWTYGPRVQMLQEYADSWGLPVTSIQAQAGFLVQEMQDPYYGCSPDELNSLGLAGATQQVWRRYENPATDDFDRRYSAAQSYMSIEPAELPDIVSATDDDFNYNNNSDDSGSTYYDGAGRGGYVMCVPDESGYGNGGGTRGGGTPVTIDGVLAYDQCDPAWGGLNYGNEGVNGHDMNSICESGCGPTSFATILKNMGIDVTPRETADLAGKAGQHAPGAGSYDTLPSVLSSHYGVTVEELPTEVGAISNALRAGKMVYTGGGGVMPYTSGGHIVAIVGITSTGDWIVADSYQTGHPAVATYNPYEMQSGMGRAFAISR